MRGGGLGEPTSAWPAYSSFRPIYWHTPAIPTSGDWMKLTTAFNLSCLLQLSICQCKTRQMARQMMPSKGAAVGRPARSNYHGLIVILLGFMDVAIEMTVEWLVICMILMCGDSTHHRTLPTLGIDFMATVAIWRYFNDEETWFCAYCSSHCSWWPSHESQHGLWFITYQYIWMPPGMMIFVLV